MVRLEKVQGENNMQMSWRSQFLLTMASERVCVFCGAKVGNSAGIRLTGDVEVDQPFVSAHFVFRQAFIHDRHAGILNVKPAHYL